MIKLSFKGNHPEECQKVLDEIVKSFDTHIKSTTKNIGGETAELVGRVKDEMLDRLKVVEKDIETLMSRPELLNVDGRIVNPHQMQLSMLHTSLNELRRERIKLKAQVQNIRSDLAAGKDLKEMAIEILRDTTETPRGNSAAQSQLVELKVSEQDLLNQYGADHPEVRKIRNQIQVVEGMVLQELAASQASTIQDLSSNYRQVVEDYAKQLDRQNQILGSEEIGLLESITEEQRVSTSVSAMVENLNTLQRERERLEKGYYTIIERLSEINAFNEHLWRNLSVLDPPCAAEKIAPSLPISLAGGLFLGSLLGLFFAGFKDMAEKTFRSSDDVGEILNSRVIGHVSLFQKVRANKRSPQFPNIMPELVTVHAPASQSSEAYRAIRTSMFFQAQESGAKVIQVTSPSPGDGKSTTISNLAASIAQSGRRVLLLSLIHISEPTRPY